MTPAGERCVRGDRYLMFDRLSDILLEEFPSVRTVGQLGTDGRRGHSRFRESDLNTSNKGHLGS